MREVHSKCLLRLINEFLRLEVSSQVEHLPGGQTQQTAHTEYTKEQYSIIGGFCE